MKKFFILFFLFWNLTDALEVRLKDIARINGIKENQIVGYGLVVGLPGTGDKMSKMTLQSIKNYLKSINISLEIGTNQIQNIASVFLTTNIPSYAQIGDKLDVTVSSIGNAKSIEGGVLVQSPLKASNGSIMAVASGVVSFGGKNKKKTQNSKKTVGTIYNGAIVEKGLNNLFLQDRNVRIILNEQDFSTLGSVADNIREEFSLKVQTELPNIVQLKIPENQNLLEILAKLENLKIEPDYKSKVVINERTGTVVMGGDIAIRESAVSIQNVPTTLSNPILMQNQKMEINKNTFLFKETTKVSEIVDILNEMNITTKEIISVLQGLKKTGALYADLEIE